MATVKAHESQSTPAVLARTAPATDRPDKAAKPAAHFATPKLREQLTAVFIKEDDGGYCGYVEEIPEAITQGDTLEEIKENLVEAVQLVMQCHRELSDQRIAEENCQVTKEKLGEVSI